MISSTLVHTHITILLFQSCRQQYRSLTSSLYSTYELKKLLRIVSANFFVNKFETFTHYVAWCYIQMLCYFKFSILWKSSCNVTYFCTCTLHQWKCIFALFHKFVAIWRHRLCKKKHCWNIEKLLWLIVTTAEKSTQNMSDKIGRHKIHIPI